MPVSLLKGLPDRREILQGLHSPWIWAVLALSLSLVGWEWLHEAVRHRAQSQARFERRIEEIRGAVLTHMNNQELVLRGGVGLHLAHDSLDREAWKSYVQALRLDRHQAGIQGVGFALFIRPGHEREWALRMGASMVRTPHPAAPPVRRRDGPHPLPRAPRGPQPARHRLRHVLRAGAPQGHGEGPGLR